jgi:putative hydrolase of the HAD superfamily
VKHLASGIEVVLFDIGGVLVELSGLPTLLRWLDNRMRVEELGAYWLSSSAVRDFETGRSAPDEFAGRVIRELSLPVDHQEFLSAFTNWIGPYPGAREVVGSVPERFTRATLSNTSALHWQRITEEFELGELFHHHFASHLTGRIKPDLEAFEHVVETLGCKPSSVFFLDDNAPNVDAARKAGMHAARVQGPQGAREALAASGILS